MIRLSLPNDSVGKGQIVHFGFGGGERPFRKRPALPFADDRVRPWPPDLDRRASCREGATELRTGVRRARGPAGLPGAIETQPERPVPGRSPGEVTGDVGPTGRPDRDRNRFDGVRGERSLESCDKRASGGPRLLCLMPLSGTSFATRQMLEPFSMNVRSRSWGHSRGRRGGVLDKRLALRCRP